MHIVVLDFYFFHIYFILEMIEQARFQLEVLWLENSYSCASRCVRRKLTRREKRRFLCYYEVIKWYNSSIALQSLAVDRWRIEGQIGWCHWRSKCHSLSKRVAIHLCSSLHYHKVVYALCSYTDTPHKPAITMLSLTYLLFMEIITFF